MPITDQITQPGRRSRASLRAILTAFAERIRELHDFNVGTVVVSDQVIPLQMPLGRRCITVSFGDGHFLENAWAGGGHQTATTHSCVVVGLFLQNGRDRPGRAETAIVESGSILNVFEELLSILTVADQSRAEYSQSWEPSLHGVPLLRSIPRPSSFSSASDVPGHAAWLGIQLVFDIEFDWDLYR